LSVSRAFELSGALKRMSKGSIFFKILGPFYSFRKKKSYNFCHTNCRKGCRKVYTSLEEGPVLGTFLLLAIIQRELIVKGVKGQLE
jgi:hypothetical protein